MVTSAVLRILSKCDSGGQGVAGSNPVAPTIDTLRKRGFLAPLFFGLKIHLDHFLDHPFLRYADSLVSFTVSGREMTSKALRVDARSGCRYRCVVRISSWPRISLLTTKFWLRRAIHVPSECRRS